MEDHEAMQRYTLRAEARWPNMAHAGRLGRNAVNRAKLLIFSELGRKGGIAFWAGKTKAEREQWARQAAAKRWRNGQVTAGG